MESSTAPQFCPYCQRALLPNARFCDNCGKPVIAIPSCPTCGTPIVEGAKFCHQCGTPIGQQAASARIATPPAAPLSEPPIPAPLPEPVNELPLAPVAVDAPPVVDIVQIPPTGPSSSPPVDFLNSPTITADEILKELPATPPKEQNPRLQIHPNGVIVQLPVKDGAILIGRSDTERGLQADIDLTPFEGKRLGVSRRHSNMYRYEDQWQIEDLNTPNFTEVNGNRVMPGDMVTIKHGDELRFGDLFARFLLD